MPRKLSVPRKNWDPQILEQRRLHAEKEIKESKVRRQAEDDKKNRLARWVQFAVAIWAVRLGLFGFGTAFGGLPSLLTALARLTGLNLLLFLPRHDIASWHWTRTRDKMDAYDSIMKGTPFVTTDVPMESLEVVQNILRKYHFKSLAKMKKPEVRVADGQLCEGFHYHNKDSAWSIRNATCSKSTELRKVTEIGFPYHSDEQQTCDGGGANCQDDAYWYLVEPFHAPLSNPILSSISKEFQEYVSSSVAHMGSSSVESMLWVSSAMAECNPHYDMPHNFFLQVAGTKTFVIAEPAASLLFRTHSYLHPYWRQAREKSLTSVAAILSATDESDGMLNSVFGSQKSSSGPWEVTLQPGDMLFLPAFYYHYVKSGPTGSTSLNMWVPSAAQACMDRIVKSVPLPFEDAEDVEIKAAKLAAVAVVAFKKLGLGDSNSLFAASRQLGKIMEGRHPLVEEDKEVARSGENLRGIPSFCNGEIGQNFRKDVYSQLQTKTGMASPAGPAKPVKESAIQVSSLLEEDLKDPAVCLHVLLDYVDEVFHSLSQRTSSPESASLFASTCFVGNEIG